MVYFRSLLLLVCSTLFVLCANAADGPLFNIPLTELPDNPELLVLEVNLEPGQESEPHRHNGYVFVYVLKGRVNMQVAGGKIVTLAAGETFYENPNDVHTVSQNASDTEAAKFIVYIIKAVGAAVTTPAPQ
jgi:quercetin dioxygenase-like cupin family protein